MSEDQIIEVMRLAGMLAVARVRRYALRVGHAPNETEKGVLLRIRETEEDLRTYLKTTT